jgi:hypothetical protein
MHEDEQDNLDGAERELEAALRGLKPGPATIDPLACAFEAGRKTGARRAIVWRSTAAAMAVALLVSILIPTRSSSSRDASPTQNEFATVVSLPSHTTGPTYFSTRDAVLDRGVDVLPASRGAATPLSLRGFYRIH